MVEQRIENPRVGGSSPSLATSDLNEGPPPDGRLFCIPSRCHPQAGFVPLPWAAPRSRPALRLRHVRQVAHADQCCEREERDACECGSQLGELGLGVDRDELLGFLGAYPRCIRGLGRLRVVSSAITNWAAASMMMTPQGAWLSAVGAPALMDAPPDRSSGGGSRPAEPGRAQGSAACISRSQVPRPIWSRHSSRAGECR